MKTKKKVFILMGATIIMILLYLLFDYINITKYVALNIQNINIDVLAIFVGNLIIITLYLITYFIVDSKNAKERKNKKDIATYMIDDDYNTCLRYLKILEDQNQLKLIIEKLNTGDYLYKNDYFNNWMNTSFKNYNDIMQYASQGIIDVCILKKYLYIRSNFSFTMSGYILSLGMPKEIENLIIEGHQNLKTEIVKEIKNLANKLEE